MYIGKPIYFPTPISLTVPRLVEGVNGEPRILRRVPGRYYRPVLGQDGGDDPFDPMTPPDFTTTETIEDVRTSPDFGPIGSAADNVGQSTSDILSTIGKVISFGVDEAGQIVKIIRPAQADRHVVLVQRPGLFSSLSSSGWFWPAVIGGGALLAFATLTRSRPRGGRH